MKYGSITSEQLAKFGGRIDAGFHLLANDHMPVVDELLERLNTEELKQLAVALHYHEEAAKRVVCGSTLPRHQEEFARWVQARHRPTDLAVYCAAAANQAASKVLEEVLELRKQELAKLEGLKALLQNALSKKLVKTHAAMKDGYKPVNPAIDPQEPPA